MLGFYLLEALKNETDHIYKPVHQTSKSISLGVREA